MIRPGFEWYVPTWYGDIRLRAIGRRRTRVEVYALTRGELEALDALRERSLRRGLFRRAWASPGDWEAMPAEAYRVGSRRRGHVVLSAPIQAIENFLTRRLRGRAETVSVAVTSRGSMHEIRAPDAEALEEDTNVIPFRRPALVRPDEEVVAATTVRKPVVGCPAPDFVRAHDRATQVLRRFLSARQLRDFERHQQFMTVGAATGHRYLITSRHARTRLGRTTRTVYDYDEDRPCCVHDWGLPAPEEMLTMHLMLSLPDWEPYVRGLEDGEEVGTLVGRRPVLEAPPAGYYYGPDGDLRVLDDDYRDPIAEDASGRSGGVR